MPSKATLIKNQALKQSKNRIIAIVKYYQGENTMRVVILVLCFCITFLSNAVAGEMYNCIDRDGNSIFTDTPQDGMKCDLKSDDMKSTTAQNQKHPRAFTSSRGLDQECIQELEASTKSCEGVSKDKSHLSQLSPDCSRQIESHQWPKPGTACSKEMQEAGKAMMSEIIECRDKHISARCRDSINSKSKRLQKESNRCSDAMKRLSSICGNILKNEANAECYDKHRLELEAACGKRLDSQPAVPPDREMP